MSEPRVYCEDWSCPARVSCAHHFGRSADYGRMDERRRFNLKKFERNSAADCCPLYQFDRKKPWLKIHPGQVTHLPESHQ